MNVVTYFILMLKKIQLYNFIKSIKTVIIYTNLPHTYKYLDNRQRTFVFLLFKLCAIIPCYDIITISKCHLLMTQNTCAQSFSPLKYTNRNIGVFLIFRKRLSENEARRYINQMTSALNYMHSQNFLHRDIKLENTVLQSGGKVFIVGEFVRSGFGAKTRIIQYAFLQKF